MKLVVGLGNPGSQYRNSRHNLGFLVAGELADRYSIVVRTKRGKFSFGEGIIKGERVLLVLPLVYMNFSGNVIAPLVKKRRIDLKDMLVICDDVNLKLGSMRFRPYGSAGGHRGLESIIANLNSTLFPRLRIGIAGVTKIGDLTKFVLGIFTKEEKRTIKEMTSKAIEAIEIWLKDGIEVAMNRANRSNA